MSKYNYKIIKWTEKAPIRMAKQATTLKENGENFVAKNVAVPINPEPLSPAMTPYNADILVWKEGKDYAIYFFVFYYCGDDIYEEHIFVPLTATVEELAEKIKNLKLKYSSDTVIDEIIDDYKKSEKEEEAS